MDTGVRSGVSKWLLVDKTAVTRDGTVCNKIGTSYTAFRNQQGACRSTAGSCLRNQLEDFQLADEQRIQRGETPVHLVTAFGDFAPYADAAGRQYAARTPIACTHAVRARRTVTERAP